MIFNMVGYGGSSGGGKGVPVFSYSGSYEVVDDSDSPISPAEYESAVFWKIRFLTSGTLFISELNGAKNGIDVFLVGGGGGGFFGNYAGGGGGGYTKTVYGKTISAGSSYPIIIGAGGAGGSTSQDGSETSAFSEIASGGIKGASNLAGNGGSGGGAYQYAGGNDGGDGGGAHGGTGQGTTTREFGESASTEYAGGGDGNSYKGTAHADGGGGTSDHPTGYPNKGGGGCGWGGSTTNNSGGAGIVIIRNARGA